MLSRVACNVYWLGRYLERAEGSARLISVHDNLLLDLPRRSATFGWAPLLAITGNEAAFDGPEREPTEAQVIAFLVSDESHPGSILSALRAARENLRTTRDLIPREAWEEVNDLYLTAAERSAECLDRRRRHDYLKRLIRGSQLLAGLLAGTMSHDTGYRFLELGLLLERADMITRILDVRSADLLRRHGPALSPWDNIQWMSVLKSLTAYQMYRQHVRLRVQGTDVLDYLLRDTAFPRAVGFCLAGIRDGLRRLPHNELPLTAIETLRRRIAEAELRALVEEAGLHRYMDELQIALAELHSLIDRTYFNPVATGSR
ncbi:MAG: alpha-E domain-containing protein [Candidatus Competibacterales bacterium]|nr:alpha-E domain-containing protein [Candidatus Competibacterales bacterium]